MNYFKAAEQVLNAVPTLEKSVENLKSREQRLIESGKPQEPGAIDYSKSFTNSHFANDTLNELLELKECTQNRVKTERELNEIKNIVEQLSDEHKKLVRLWYFEKLSKESVMEELHIESLSTVYNLRNKAVTEFALLYYGASALNSI